MGNFDLRNRMLSNETMGSKKLIDVSDEENKLTNAIPDDSVEKLLAMADRCRDAGDWAEAERLYVQIMNCRPSDGQVKANLAEVSYRLANALRGAGNIGAAIAAYTRAIALRRDFTAAIVNLGVAHAVAGQWPGAIAAFSRAVALQPDNVEYQHNLASALQCGGRREEAVLSYRAALRLRPHFAEGWAALGNVYAELNQPQNAIDAFQRAVAIRPNFPVAQLNLGLAQLQVGDFEQGWRQFEWRLLVSEMNLARGFTQPQWRGEDISGKTILLHAEGGFGDALQFVRYAPKVAAGGARVLLECAASLVPLLKSVSGVSEVIARGQPLPHFDFQIPLPSLPGVFGTRIDNIPAEHPYLKSPPDRVEYWKSRLSQYPGLKVGLVWAGSGPMLSGTLGMYAPLARIAGIQLFSLQKGPAASETVPAGMNLRDFTNELFDFAETAALVDCLDLVISIDTSVAHLAGALGKPVWIALVPSFSDFRWLLNRADSPWYPTARLFRQARTGHWESAINQIVEALNSWSARAIS
jgi:tetratricopeptide (TPR) repeat protein